MRRSSFAIVLITCIISATACRHGGNNTEPAVLTLATYNVGVFDKSGTNTTGMIASMMKELGVQVLGMNELDSCNLRHPEFQLRDFAEAIGGWNYIFAPAINYKGGKYGIGTVSSAELKPVRQYGITLDQAGGAEQRAMAVSVFDDFVFCATHLDYKSAEAQISQVKQICAWASVNYGDSDIPVFMCGDFNAEPDSETIKLMKKDWTILSPLQPTFSAKNPVKCIDYIMVYKNASQRVKLLDSGVAAEFKTGDVTVASDHLPVFVKVELAQRHRMAVDAVGNRAKLSGENVPDD